MLTELPWTIGWVCLAVVGFLASLGGHSLRDFSRSRLEEICRQRHRADRFGEILRRHESVLLALDCIFLFALSGLLLMLSARFAWSSSAAGWLGRLQSMGQGVLLFLALAVFLVMVPWSLARAVGEPFLARCWPLLRTGWLLMRPLLALAERLDTLVHRLFGIVEPTNGDAAAITEEIRTVVDEGQREGVLESEAGTMIHRVMELRDVDAAAVMTPRTDMVCIPVTASLEEARRILVEAGHSRVPVIGESTDDIVGILYAKDLLKVCEADAQQPGLREIVREPIYVPETTGVDKLLETMKREQVHVAIVLDEYGGVAGLVTLEDILEEIVGEIADEYDKATEAPIRRVAPGTIEVDARVHVDDLNEEFGFDLPEDGDFDTVGGFVFTQLGRIPAVGESFEWRRLRFTVLEANKRRIDKLRIEVVEPTHAASTTEQP